MPKRMFITQDEKTMPGHKLMKYRLNLLLCGTASGYCKWKPLKLYHSETPIMFSRNNRIKSKLCDVEEKQEIMVHEAKFY